MYMNRQMTFIDPKIPMNTDSWHQVIKHEDAVGVYNLFLKGIICIKNMLSNFQNSL